MSVWLCIPSKRPPEEAEKCLKLWRERGYKIALARDQFDGVPPATHWVVMPVYPGYSIATNRLVLDVLKHEPQCDWVVLGGDDVEPDANHSAEQIARQCTDHFKALAHTYHVPWRDPDEINSGCWSNDERICDRIASTFGVMQPTGDRWGDKQGAYADRVCGSPWIGREFALRINQGRGPLWHEYFHMYEDEELFEVAQTLGVLWQRPDLIHYHHHWARERGRIEDMPEFLKRANSQEEWRKAKALFEQRKAMGFPGSEPL